jgi:hypothetical protein
VAVQGSFFWIDRALKKRDDGTFKLDGSQTIKAVLLASSQAVARGFLGSSGDARYADLTGELATANGYTAGGAALTGVALERASANIVRFRSDPIAWTLTGSVTFKYLALYVFGATNKDLLMVSDMDTGGGTVTAPTGVLQFNPDPTNGWGTESQT